MKSFHTHGVGYTLDDLQRIRELVGAGMTAPDAVKRIIPNLAQIPAAVQAVIVTARTHGLVRFDQEQRRWMAGEGVTRQIGRRKVCEGAVSTRTVYVPDELWEALKRKHGRDLQKAIRAALAASLT